MSMSPLSHHNMRLVGGGWNCTVTSRQYGCTSRSEQLQASKAPVHGLMPVPIYAALSPENQARVFEPAPAGKRRVCVSHHTMNPCMKFAPDLLSYDASAQHLRMPGMRRSSWPRTLRRHLSPCRACATSWTQAL